MVNVRKMEFRDIKKVVELEEKYLLESLGEKLLASELSEKNNGVSFYVIENDDVVIGYIGRYYFFQEAEVLNFVVDESYQRQGYVGVRKKYYKNGEDALLLLKEFIWKF